MRQFKKRRPAEIDWMYSCGELFIYRDDAWKHPFNSEHVMRDRQDKRQSVEKV